MRRTAVVVWVGILASACAGGIASCSSALDQPSVAFGSAAPIGRWQDYAGSDRESQSTAGANGTAAAGGMLVNAGSASEGGVAPKAGTSGATGIGASAGRGAAGAAAVGGGAAGGLAGSAAGSGASGSTGTPAGSITNLAFDVTTSPVGGRYQPKNIGAIWVQDKNGKLVKSLAVWAGIRRRYLTKYASALSGTAVDVTASATLPSHRAHHVTWNLKDRSGAAVAPGQYTLVMELTDGDMTGHSNTLPFDTSAGTLSQTPVNVPSFGSMSLQLQ